MDTVFTMELYENALATFKNCKISMISDDLTRVWVLRKLIEKGEFEMPRLGNLDARDRELWEELAEYASLDRNAQIKVFVDFIKKKVPQQYWVNLV